MTVCIMMCNYISSKALLKSKHRSHSYLSLQSTSCWRTISDHQPRSSSGWSIGRITYYFTSSTVFENHPKCLIWIIPFWPFEIDLAGNPFWPHKRSSLRSQCCKMRLFLWFSNTVLQTSTGEGRRFNNLKAARVASRRGAIWKSDCDTFSAASVFSNSLFHCHYHQNRHGKQIYQFIFNIS